MKLTPHTFDLREDLEVERYMMINDHEFINTCCFNPSLPMEMDKEDTTFDGEMTMSWTVAGDTLDISKERPCQPTPEKFSQELEKLKSRTENMDGMLNQYIQSSQQWQKSKDQLLEQAFKAQ